MALPDYYKIDPISGTPITVTITLTSVANGSARQSAKFDFGAIFARRWLATFETKFAIAPTNDTEVELYLSQSSNATAGTGNTGGTSGADAAFSNSSELKKQLEPIGSLACSNALGTGTQRQAFEFQPTQRYGSVVVVNNSGQALSSTAGDHIITLQPLDELINDTV